MSISAFTCRNTCRNYGRYHRAMPAWPATFTRLRAAAPRRISRPVRAVRAWHLAQREPAAARSVEVAAVEDALVGLDQREQQAVALWVAGADDDVTSSQKT